MQRQPFPGPGLAVRIIGEVNPEIARDRARGRLDRHAARSTRRYDLQPRPWQYFAVLTPVRSVGVMGDGRTYANLVGVRAITSEDGMTADWARLPHALLERISTRIVNEVPGVNRVAYDITSKPPVHRRVGIDRLRILVVGGGAREDALSWKLAQSPSCEALFHAPGNAGTASRGRTWNVARDRRRDARRRAPSRGHRFGRHRPRDRRSPPASADRLRDAGLCGIRSEPFRRRGSSRARSSPSASWSVTAFRPRARVVVHSLERARQGARSSGRAAVSS